MSSDKNLPVIFILELSGAVYTLADRVSNVFCDRHLRGQF